VDATQAFSALRRSTVKLRAIIGVLCATHDMHMPTA